jgi:hypothetical protein
MGSHRGTACAVTASAACLASIVLIAGQTLDETTLSQALTLGRGQRLDPLQQFHAGYRVEPASAPLMELDVITLYRRAVMLAEQASRMGNRWTTRDLAQALVRYDQQIGVHASVRLHPHNVFVTPPPYSIELVAPNGERIRPVEVQREPMYPPRAPRQGAAMSGVSVEAIFDVTALDILGCCDTVVLDQAGAQVARQHVNFVSFR